LPAGGVTHQRECREQARKERSEAEIGAVRGPAITLVLASNDTLIDG